MDEKFVDTNIFVEIITRVGKKSDQSKKLVESAIDLFTNSLVFSEVEWVLRSVYNQKKSLVVEFLKKILSSNIRIEDRKVIIDAVNFYEERAVDWTDCLNMSFVKEKDGKQVYSYDKGLSKFDWIKRLEP